MGVKTAVTKTVPMLTTRSHTWLLTKSNITPPRSTTSSSAHNLYRIDGRLAHAVRVWLNPRNDQLRYLYYLNPLMRVDTNGVCRP